MRILNKLTRRLLLSLLLSGVILHAHAVLFEVTIQGVEQKLEKNIREGLSLIQKSKNRELSLEQIQMLNRRAPDEIKQALEPFGYYHSEIKSTLNETTWPVEIVYLITVNTPTRVDDIKLDLEGEGQHNPILRQSLLEFPLKAGDIFDHAVYEEGKTDLEQTAINEGYVTAFFAKRQVLVDLSGYTADIDLSLNTGPQFHLNGVTFKNGYYHPDFLQRFVVFDQTTPYRLEEVVSLEHRLMQSNLFSSVHAVPIIDDDAQTVPLEVNLQDAKANRYLIGAGYDTNTRARAKLGWERKKISRFGHQFKSYFKISEKDTLLDASYSIPGKKPWVDQYRLSAAYADEEYTDKPSEVFTVEISETREIWSWSRTIALRYLKENFKDSDFIGESSRFLLPSLTLAKTKLDNPTQPRNGYRVKLNLRGGLDALLSDHDFGQIQMEGKWLKSIGTYGTFIARAELGATFPRDVEQLPLSIRFYAGGNESLRGFRYRSLPNEVDKDGYLQPVGGAYLALGSLEYDHTIYGPFQLAIFTDGGGALRHLDDDLQASAGFGLRWQTPIGPLKIDVAKPLTNAAKVWRLHFSFGPEL